MAVEVISKIKPKNNGSFFIVDARDVETQEGKSLEEKLNEIKESIDTENTDFVETFETALTGSESQGS